MRDTSGRGFTPRELARILRVSPERVRRWIASGELRAINTASVRCGRPRYIVLPHHLAEWEQGRQAAAPKRTPRKRAAVGAVDYYPD